MRHTLLALFFLFAAEAAFACCPTVSPNDVTMNVGETVVLHGATTPGLANLPQFVTFQSATPQVIAVDGKIAGTTFSCDVRVTALAPGQGRIAYVAGDGIARDIGVVTVNDCSGTTLTLPEYLSAAVGVPFTLAPVVSGGSPITFQWYRGLGLGLEAIDGATAADFTFVPKQPGSYAFILRAWTPCGERSVTVTVTAGAGRRRVAYD